MTHHSSLAQPFSQITPRHPELRGRIALVTGSARGIGQAIALRLAREGMRLVIHGLEAEATEQTAAQLRALGADVFPVCLDLSLPDSPDQLIDAVLAAFGGLDVLVNNAAFLFRAPVAAVTREQMERSFATNIRAPALLCQRAAGVMMAQQHGSIINISSVGGLRAHWKALPYDVTKGALDALTRSLAPELARHAVPVNAVAPGRIEVQRNHPPSPQELAAIPQVIPMGRSGTPLEVAALVAFLASDEAGYITGQVIYIDGGLTAQLAPENAQV